MNKENKNQSDSSASLKEDSRVQPPEEENLTEADDLNYWRNRALAEEKATDLWKEKYAKCHEDFMKMAEICTKKAAQIKRLEESSVSLPLNNQKWIKVSDEMPEQNVGVLVFIPEEDNHITAGMWDVSKKWVLLDEYRVPECEVTHWMTLPKNPNNETD